MSNISYTFFLLATGATEQCEILSSDEFSIEEECDSSSSNSDVMPGRKKSLSRANACRGIGRARSLSSGRGNCLGRGRSVSGVGRGRLISGVGRGRLISGVGRGRLISGVGRGRPGRGRPGRGRLISGVGRSRGGSVVGRSLPVSSIGRGRGSSRGHTLRQTSGSSSLATQRSLSPVEGPWAKVSPTSLQYNHFVTPGPTSPIGDSCSVLELFERFFYTRCLGITCSRNKCKICNRYNPTCKIMERY